MSTKENTLGGQQLFKDEILESLIFHIPHSQTLIPIYDKFNLDLIDGQIKLLTDFHTDELFSIPNTSNIVFPYSRIYCDVERLPDINEPMFKKGRGFYYTHTDDGRELRVLDIENKATVLEFYNQHHNKLLSMVEDKLAKLGFATIIDCHSFSDTPFQSDLDQTTPRPDVCIGTDPFHTPEFLINLIQKGFENHGYSVKINAPYSGTIVPLNHHNKTKEVQSVMIELNRKLFTSGGVTDYKKIAELKKVIVGIFSF